ncbi:MAG: DNA repair protein RadC [Desulfobacteraceae bacterium]|nr:DNA repair protein RadC [Desulfobacteraceae bacterium]
MKKITFSVTEDQHEKIKATAEAEGLSPAQYAKRQTIIGVNSQTADISRVRESPRGFNSPQALLGQLAHIAEKAQEHFVAITMDSKNKIIANRIITIGLLNSSQVHPREVFADAITDRAATMIVAHNHPSGDCYPSPEDIAITKRLVQTGEIIGIPVRDHIIISADEYKSFMELGVMGNIQRDLD